MILIRPFNIGGHFQAEAPPPPAVNFDDIVAEAGATHHARFLAGAGTTAEDVIGTIDWTINNSVGWQRGAIVNDANGGNSAFFNGVGVSPTYAQATNLITSDTWAALFVIQVDAVQDKFVLLDSGATDGGYSCEVEPDGVGGMWARQFTRIAGSASAWVTGNGSIPASDAILVAYLQIEGQGRFIYAGTAASFDLIGSNTAQTTFDAVPAGTHYLGAWNLAGGLQAPLKGLIGEVMIWNGSTPSLVHMQQMAAKLKSVVYLPTTIDAGIGLIGQTFSIDVGAYSNPSADFTPVKLTDPAAGGGTVAVVGEEFQITGHNTASDFSFTGRITRTDVVGNVLTSGTATISYEMQAASPSVGIQIPQFEYQTISDSVPGGAIWWNPTSGNDSNSGATKALAKKTFSAAQTAVAAGGTIVCVGGTHVVPELTMTKSGTNTNNRITLRSEPDTTVVLYRNGDFRGALEQTWTWTVVNAGLGIWQSPNLGISDSKTIVNVNGNAGSVSGGSALWGAMVCPNGAHGRPHLMRMFWYDRDGDYAADAFHAPNTGANAHRFIKDGGYGGPGFHVPGDGRVQVRMQKLTSVYTGTEWPRDGRMGTLIDPDTGLWQEPITEDPNDYAFHIVRFNANNNAGADFGTDGPTLINLNGQKWWHVKGINGALINVGIKLPTGSTNNWFEKCTLYPQGIGVWMIGTSNNNRFTRCQFLGADNRSVSWSEHKNANYWNQHGRTAGLYAIGGSTATTGVGTLLEHCVFFGWFDLALGFVNMDGTITYDHCAILNTGDDGLMQGSNAGDWSFDAYYCYFAGGPPWSGEGNSAVGSRDWYWHHNVIDNRIPMMWSPLNAGHVQKNGVHPNELFPTHSGGATGPVRVLKFWNNTVIQAPDSQNLSLHTVITGPSGQNIPLARAHEVYNNIIVIRDNKRYLNEPACDPCITRLSCQRSSAGTHRFDYNCWFRTVPNPVDPFCYQIQNSRGTGQANYTSLAAFRSSAHKTTSESMYASGTGGFSGAIGIDGHEAHGVQVNPGFVNLTNLDYRPTHASVTSGRLNVSSSGWPGANSDNWKGALDPNGDGTEVGPSPG